jgi:hypothetical protein
MTLSGRGQPHIAIEKPVSASQNGSATLPIFVVCT